MANKPALPGMFPGSQQTGAAQAAQAVASAAGVFETVLAGAVKAKTGAHLADVVGSLTVAPVKTSGPK